MLRPCPARCTEKPHRETDTKVNFDDNASYRQKEIHDQRDTSQENPIEATAQHSEDMMGAAETESVDNILP